MTTFEKDLLGILFAGVVFVSSLLAFTIYKVGKVHDEVVQMNTHMRAIAGSLGKIAKGLNSSAGDD